MHRQLKQRRNRPHIPENSQEIGSIKSQGSCYQCGGSHKANECKFKSATCNFFSKAGHIAIVCKAKKRNQAQQSQSDSAKSSSLHQMVTHSLFYLSDHCKTKPKYISVSINDKPLKFEFDCGAPATVIDHNTYLKIFENEKQSQINIDDKGVFHSYGGHPITILGLVSVRANLNGVVRNVSLLVSGDNGPPLWGRNWNEYFGIDVDKLLQISYHTDPFAELLSRFSDLFDRTHGNYQGPPAVLHMVDNARPIFMRARPVPFALRSKIDAELDRLEAQGFYTPIKHSRWASAIVPVVKHDGTIRICGDYKTTINQFAKPDIYPLPRHEELFAALSGGSHFMKLDLQHAYNQIRLDEASKALVTVNTHRGLYQVNRLPFGVSAASAIFQRIMDTLLKDIPGTAIFQDDIVVTGRTLETHLASLTEVFSRLSNAGFRLKKDKCVFQAESVEYLGYKISSKGIYPTYDKVKAIRDAPRPASVAELQAFLGLINFYARFLPNLATVLDPLHRLLDKGKQWFWGKRQEQAFETAKTSLSSDKVLCHFDESVPLTLICDASPVELGAILAHRFQDGTERPIAFASRTLTKAERNYTQLDKEAAALIFGLTKFHLYLFGRPFDIITDHKPLLGILGRTKKLPTLLSPRLLRWALTMSNYDYSYTDLDLAFHMQTLLVDYHCLLTQTSSISSSIFLCWTIWKIKSRGRTLLMPWKLTSFCRRFYFTYGLRGLKTSLPSYGHTTVVEMSCLLNRTYCYEGIELYYPMF